jgi:hypothetical protein
VGRSDRRAALRTLAASAIGAATAPTWVESLCAFARQQAHAHVADAALAAQDWTPAVLTPAQNEAVATLSELIIPETDTPGARATRVNRFIDAVLSRAPQPDREKFLRGLSWMDDRSRMLFKRDFVQASPVDQAALLTRLADERNDTADDRAGVEFFRTIKSMTIDGYYTTEVGLRRELGDDGRLFHAQFQGCEHPEHQS